MNRLFGGLLLAAGILIAGASGLCSTVFGVIMLTSAGAGQGGLNGFVGVMLMILVVGGTPFAGGISMILIARRMLRRESDAPDHRDVF